jgi:glutathione synthase/RimK-type ligase-like ATP-grasp enzyme
LSRGAEEEIAFTSLLDGISPSDEASIRVSPVIYQRAVKKARDLRITVVGARVFACEITQTDASEIDWRRLDTEHLSYRAVELPLPLADLCISLVNALELGFGAIDLVQDHDDRYWFLEINPNGQWAWIERQARLPIAAAIVDVLTAEDD